MKKIFMIKKKDIKFSFILIFGLLLCLSSNIKADTLTASSSRPKATSITQIKNTFIGVELTWKKVDNASDYFIWRKTGKNSYSLIQCVSGDTTSWTDSSVIGKNGTGFTYIIYTYNNGMKGPASNHKYTIYITSPNLNSVSTSANKATITWNSVKRASGYQLQYSQDQSFSTGVKYSTVKGNSRVKATLKNLKKNKIYYVRIRSYCLKNGKHKYYSDWSSLTGDFRTAAGKNTSVSVQKGAKAVTVKSDRIKWNTEQLFVDGYSTNGKIVWTYKTGIYTSTELNATSCIVHNNRVYIFEGNMVTALNKTTGKIIWTCKNTSSYGHSAAVDSQNNIYVTSYYDSRFVYKINSKGKIVWRSDVSQTGNCWPYKMFLQNGKLTVTYDGSTSKSQSNNGYTIVFNTATGRILKN